MLNFVMNKKRKAWVISGVSAALVLSCAGVVWVDHGTIGEEREKITELEGQIAAADAKIATIPGVEDRVLGERLKVSEYTKILPLDKDINAFVDRITEFEAASGVEIEVLDDKTARDRNKGKKVSAFTPIVYKIELIADVEQFLSFVNFFESYDRFVAVKEFSVKGGDPVFLDDGSIVPARHKISMVLETYVYNGTTDTWRPVEIMNGAERMREIEEQRGPVAALQLEQYDYVRSPNRRDPFANPRRPIRQAPAAEDDSAALEEQREVLARLEKDLKEILDWSAKEKDESDLVLRYELSRRINAQATKLRLEIAKIDPKTYFSAPETRETFQTRVADPLKRFLDSRPGADSMEFPLKELETQLAKMKEGFKKRQFADVVALGQTLLKSRHADDPAAFVKVYERVEALAAKAQVHLDFTTIEMAFQGHVLPDRAPDRAVVIINGRAYSRGDQMDEGLIVEEIGASSVEFVYRGERIIRSTD